MRKNLTVVISVGISILVVASFVTKDETTSGDRGLFSLDYVEDFPAMTTDGQGEIWLAQIERPELARQIGVYRVAGNVKERIATLTLAGISGIGRPAIAGLGRGCFVAFAVELNGTYRIAYARIESDKRDSDCRLIAHEGTAQIEPSLAVSGNRVWCVWESNARGWRSIEAVWIDEQGNVSAPQMISRASTNNSNPSVVAAKDGRLLAVWDSLRDDEIDLYGAWHRNGEWQPDFRVTSNPRIERHVDLATFNNRVWLAWEAQSYFGDRVNTVIEQRIAVAELVDNELMGPVSDPDYGSFDFKHPNARALLGSDSISGLFKRPQISFDPAGRLWLSAREAIDRQSGWRAVVWNYSGTDWSEPVLLSKERGRWRPVAMAFGSTGGFAAVQYDDQPVANGIDSGIHPDWHSEVRMIEIANTGRQEVQPPATGPLRMPQTDFKLADRIEASNARQPRQEITFNGQKLSLFWGNLHVHSDLSVCSRIPNAPINDLYAIHRDLELLDFISVTDHGYSLDNSLWAYTTDQVGQYHDPGRYVTLLGQEWTSDRRWLANGDKAAGYGHHNIIFADPHYPRFFDAWDDDISPAQVWSEIAGTDFVMFPHQLAEWKMLKGIGTPPKNWDFTHERHMPLAEIFQNRGSYEYLGAPRQARHSLDRKGYYLQDAWERQIVIGVIANTDHGGGSGKTGVWAPELSRESLFDAFHARHTFGTSGSKIALFFSSGSAMMGDKVQLMPDASPRFQLSVVAGVAIDEVVIFRNNEIVYSSKPGLKELVIDWTDQQELAADFLWYYARVQCENEELAWSSPIWFIK